MGVMQAHKRCMMKTKKSDTCVNGKKEFILMLHKTVVMHLDELRVDFLIQ